LIRGDDEVVNFSIFENKLEIVYCYHYRINNNNNYFKGTTNPQCEEYLFTVSSNPQILLVLYQFQIITTTTTTIIIIIIIIIVIIIISSFTY